MRAATRHETPSGNEGIYESFSDMVLCTLIVLITLVVVLALNVVEQLNVYLEPNHFTGGATRPWLYVQAENADYSKTTSDRLALERAVYGDAPFVMVNLFSPSSAHSTTTVKDGQTVSSKAGQSFLGQCDLTAYNFLQLASGIEPGAFPVAGNPTALMLPKFSHKSIQLESNATGGYTASPDNELALKTMALAWPVYGSELFPRRAAGDYMNARTKIYIEVLDTEDEAHRIMIGHSVFTLPQDVENGRLGWLAGFSSGLTEVVYLGTAWNNAAEKTNKRIAFFEENGFDHAADDYRAFSFPTGITTGQEKLLKQAMAARPDVPEEQLKLHVRSAEAQQAISKAIVENGNARAFLPPLLVHREAWNAYIENSTKAEVGTNPPDWLMSEFLEPLGFNQAVVRGLREDA
ncbi:hypothetical protein [Pontiella sulfatireligans]|uniref:Uncharacterized protein n=1 Tax=Pontiella sulfatireligans TaxID=2750658 RepID=A0A6C2UVB3_9BACT|nr:hypothetical protein [Pontiella sulfatireligans]VGO22786.1 hypothetical protein SCARR_04883 [Pontiella sulfatireligans]